MPWPIIARGVLGKRVRQAVYGYAGYRASKRARYASLSYKKRRRYRRKRIQRRKFHRRGGALVPPRKSKALIFRPYRPYYGRHQSVARLLKSGYEWGHMAYTLQNVYAANDRIYYTVNNIAAPLAHTQLTGVSGSDGVPVAETSVFNYPPGERIYITSINLRIRIRGDGMSDPTAFQGYIARVSLLQPKSANTTEANALTGVPSAENQAFSSEKFNIIGSKTYKVDDYSEIRKTWYWNIKIPVHKWIRTTTDQSATGLSDWAIDESRFFYLYAENYPAMNSTGHQVRFEAQWRMYFLHHAPSP